jgi:hypothetical protein
MYSGRVGISAGHVCSAEPRVHTPFLLLLMSVLFGPDASVDTSDFSIRPQHFWNLKIPNSVAAHLAQSVLAGAVVENDALRAWTRKVAGGPARFFSKHKDAGDMDYIMIKYNFVSEIRNKNLKKYYWKVTFRNATVTIQGKTDFAKYMGVTDTAIQTTFIESKNANSVLYECFGILYGFAFETVQYGSSGDDGVLELLMPGTLSSRFPRSVWAPPRVADNTHAVHPDLLDDEDARTARRDFALSMFLSDDATGARAPDAPDLPGFAELHGLPPFDACSR